ncbi:hypothetical protein DOZ80_26510 [Pseudomonas fluorescens]|uniref:Uncharacterized protein n=1 Tax=Pseudomonas fluorescens TaxID=294 RepID=A0A327MP69_PSEFL|nr:hypothetical protein DOZ80_26510 [Pseudomonas fluorescens]
MTRPLVGASLLAKNSRMPRSFRMCALSLATFASKLAPTGCGEISNARQHKGEPKLPFNLSLRVLFFYY